MRVTGDDGFGQSIVLVDHIDAEAVAVFGYDFVGRLIPLTGLEMRLYRIHQQMMTTYCRKASVPRMIRGRS